MFHPAGAGNRKTGKAGKMPGEPSGYRVEAQAS